MKKTRVRNLNILIDTVDTLKGSQGFYSRAWQDLKQMSLSQAKRLAKSLPRFNDTMDVIFYLES